jgi:indoleamine 2,3-dioxygenase
MPILSNYTDGFFNVSATHGFLPIKAPLVKLPSIYSDLQSVLDNMPVVINENEFGYLNKEDGIVAPTLAIKNHLAAVEKEEDIFVLQALFRSYSFLASAYLLEPSFQQYRKDGKYGKARNVLPANIAQPFCKVADKLNVFAWLDYHLSLIHI